MSSLSDDIIKYKKGELSPKEMHALEKKALNDPFLADALEGADSISAEDFSNNVQLLQEKIKGGGKNRLFTPLRIAAGFLLIAVASFIIYQFSAQDDRLAIQKEKQQPTLKVDSVKPAPQQTATQSASSSKTSEQKPEAEKPVSKPLIAHTKQSGPTSASNNKTVDEKPKVDSNSLAQANDQSTSFQVSESIVSTEVASGNAQPTVAKEEPKTDVTLSPSSLAEAKKKEVAAPRMAKMAREELMKKISGQVISAADGSPMPGVNVMVKGTDLGTVTDASGYFQINLNQSNQPLVFSFIGYESQEVNTDEKNKMDVSMKEDATQLSEVVVTGYAAPNDSDTEPVIRLAEPIGGRKAYDKYLDDNLLYPQQALDAKVKGRVVIEFTVRIDGSLDEFNVIKKLGYGCDEEVIRLVKEGPHWKPTTQDNVAVESNVRVRMKFNAEKKK